MILRPVPLTDGLFLDFLVSHNRIVAAGYKYARAEILPVVAFEREQYSRVRSSDALLVRDDAGDNLRIYISQLRAILDDQVTIQQRVLRDVAVNEAQRFDRAWVASIKAGANVDVSLLIRDDDLVDFLSLRAQEHVGLIKSLSDDVAQYIERTALGSILEGRGNRETEKLLSQFEGINRNRARLIARDQASKLNGAMNQFRQEQAGVTHYKWSTTIDGRERPEHHARNGRVFAWARPPSDGHPGRAINCRCRALAVLIDDEADARSVTPGPETEGIDIVSDNSALISRVGRTINEPILSWTQEALLKRKVEVEDVRALLTLIHGTQQAVEDDITRIYVKLYGHEPDLSEIDRSRQSRTKVLGAAIRERLNITRDLLEHALRS